MPTVAEQTIVARTALRLRDGGPTTATDLARTLEISRTSVENALAQLQDAGLVADAQPLPGRGAGRPARHYGFSASAGLVAGVDVGVHSVRVVLSDLAGVVVAHERAPGLDPDDDAATQLNAVVAAIDAAVAAVQTPHGGLRAVGVALPGIVDDAGRVVASVILTAWPGVDVARLLQDRLGCPVVLDNGVRLAAVAEHHLGAARLVDDVLYLSVGARIAAGIILDGRPRRGPHNAAGDIGRLAFRGIDEDTGQIAWHTAESGEEVFALAESGHADARAELTGFIDELARGIATLAMTIDPAVVVIGGGMSLAREALLAPLRSAVMRRIRIPVDLPIVAARLGGEAAAHGALVFAFIRCAEDVTGLPDLPPPPIAPIEDAALVAADR